MAYPLEKIITSTSPSSLRSSLPRPLAMGPALTSEAMSARRRACDICRQRKAKCIVDSSQRMADVDSSNEELPLRPCDGCIKLGAKCTYDMGYKKPGRPSIWARRYTSDGASALASRQCCVHFDRNLTSYETTDQERNLAQRSHRPGSSPPRYLDTSREAVEDENSAGLLSSGSTIHALLADPPVPNLLASPLELYPMGSSDMMVPENNVDPPQGTSGSFSEPLGQADGMLPPLIEQMAPTFAVELPGPASSEGVVNMVKGPLHEPADVGRDSSLSTPFQHYLMASRRSDIQIEDVTSWSTVGFFLSLYLRYMHSLLPLVHKPTFTRALAIRQDKDDAEFRAFLFGLVAYTIGQCPMARLQHFMQRPQLIRLQSDCHRASMLLLEKRYKDPSLLRIGGLITGYFYCASVGRSNKAGTLLAEACHLIHVMKLHDDRHISSLGLNPCEIDLRRRFFWHVYAVDITEASAGMPIHLQSYEGLPPYPLEVDDELITAQGYFDQPTGETSYMTGFKRCVSLFPIMAECLVQHRSLLHRQHPLTPNERLSAFDWIQRAAIEVDNIIDSLPPSLRKVDPVEPRDEERNGMFGMQRANLFITAASVRFILFDYKAAIEPTAEIAAERDTASREVLQTLTKIPLNSLAANGESARGKVFRIILALMRSDGALETWGDTLNDWWNMYSAIQFVQLAAYNVESSSPSRACSPM